MSQTRAQPSGGAAGGAIEQWRRQRLAAAGFEPHLAAQLAEEPAVDLHELLVLIDRGCPPELAARILAPLPPADPRC
jgi:hypothetical protein